MSYLKKKVNIYMISFSLVRFLKTKKFKHYHYFWFFIDLIVVRKKMAYVIARYLDEGFMN